MKKIVIGSMLFAAVISACTPFSAKPTVVINAPPSGSEFREGEEIAIQSTASDSQGVTRIELFVDGAAARMDAAPNPQAQFSLIQKWKATAGTHTISVRAYNAAGVSSEPAAISITVAPAVAIGSPPAPPAAPTLASSTVAPSAPTTAAPSAPTTAPPVLTALPPAPPAFASPTNTEPPPPTDSPPPTPEPPPTQAPTVPAAPAAPSAFVATGTGTTIEFTWTDNSLNELGFRIYQVGEVAPVVSRPAHTATGGVAYSWTGRPCNMSATFFIRAYNAAGESASSSTNAATTIPCAPSALSAVGASQSSVNVSFTDNATNEWGFRVYRVGSASIQESLTARSGTGAKTGTVSPIICGQTYTYFVRAYNGAGESTSSNNNDAKTSGCTVAVMFTSIRLHNDTDADNDAEVWLDIDVEGTARRWPSSPSDTVSINEGETKAIVGVIVVKTMDRTNNLTISVKGTDSDGFFGTDKLGTALQTYSGASTWSEGNRCDESADPNYFRICYTISVTP